jgi:hypothetical protein
MAGWQIMTGNLLLADDWQTFVAADVLWLMTLCEELLVTFCEVTFCRDTVNTSYGEATN